MMTVMRILTLLQPSPQILWQVLGQHIILETVHPQQMLRSQVWNLSHPQRMLRTTTAPSDLNYLKWAVAEKFKRVLAIHIVLMWISDIYVF